jgi:hypothetical protein
MDKQAMSLIVSTSKPIYIKETLNLNSVTGYSFPKGVNRDGRRYPVDFSLQQGDMPKHELQKADSSNRK